MQRYFLEVAYKGTNYSGFQIQNNARTIQLEVETALNIFFKTKVDLTGSSRTDAGVHALQNFFHFDSDIAFEQKQIYNINSILPKDIVIKNIYKVPENAHSRFDALHRSYKYFVYQNKNPFNEDRGYFFPFKIDKNSLEETAKIILKYTDFTSFSKKHTQVNNFNCSIYKSYWSEEDDCLIYNVCGNRFLRGMVRGLVATQLKVARGHLKLKDFNEIIESKNCNKAFFEAPAQGLFLTEVFYGNEYFTT